MRALQAAKTSRGSGALDTGLHVLCAARVGVSGGRAGGGVGLTPMFAVSAAGCPVLRTPSPAPGASATAPVGAAAASRTPPRSKPRPASPSAAGSLPAPARALPRAALGARCPPEVSWAVSPSTAYFGACGAVAPGKSPEVELPGGSTVLRNGASRGMGAAMRLCVEPEPARPSWFLPPRAKPCVLGPGTSG